MIATRYLPLSIRFIWTCEWPACFDAWASLDADEARIPRHAAAQMAASAFAEFVPFIAVSSFCCEQQCAESTKLCLATQLDTTNAGRLVARARIPAMATVRPFRALRPQPKNAASVSSVPYDVVSTEEARRLAAGNPLSFLHVSRAEIDFPDGTDPYSDAV